jgi:hypothetical protein
MLTTLKACGRRGILTVDVNMLIYAFGLPLFVALTFAARDGNGGALLIAASMQLFIAGRDRRPANVPSPARRWWRRRLVLGARSGSMRLPISSDR